MPPARSYVEAMFNYFKGDFLAINVRHKVGTYNEPCASPIPTFSSNKENLLNWFYGYSHSFKKQTFLYQKRIGMPSV